MKSPHLISVCICAYCMINAGDLFGPWIQSRGMSTDAIAFVLWSSPVVSFWFSRKPLPIAAEESPAALGLSLMLSFFGVAGSLRVLTHLGFALSLFALLPFTPFHLVWLASSCSWMPVFDWLGGRLFPAHVTELKLAAAALPSLYLVARIGLLRRRSP